VIREGRLEVVRTARYCSVGGEAGVADLWIVLHGYRQLARYFLARFIPLSGPTRKIVAPEGLSRFYLDDAGGPHGPEDRVGASWMTREAREEEIRDYIRYLDGLTESLCRERDGAPRPRLVLGFSQGAHTAARWVAAGGVAPRLLVLWGAGLPGDLDVEALARSMEGGEVALVRGEGDPLHSPSELQGNLAALREHGVVARETLHPGGHQVDAGVLERMSAAP
jgi:predicted esterase